MDNRRLSRGKPQNRLDPPSFHLPPPPRAIAQAPNHSQAAFGLREPLEIRADHAAQLALLIRDVQGRPFRLTAHGDNARDRNHLVESVRDRGRCHRLDDFTRRRWNQGNATPESMNSHTISGSSAQTAAIDNATIATQTQRTWRTIQGGSPPANPIRIRSVRVRHPTTRSMRPPPFTGGLVGSGSVPPEPSPHESRRGPSKRCDSDADMSVDDGLNHAPGPMTDDSGPDLLLETGLVGGSDGRALLRSTSRYYGLALIAWREQDRWRIPDRIAFFRDLERLWPEQSTHVGRSAKPQSPEGRQVVELRARAAAKGLANGKTRSEIAGFWDLKSDSLRRSGVWDRAEEILREGGPKPLRPAPPNDGGLAATVHDGVLPGPGEHAAGFVLTAVDGTPGDRRPTFYDVRTLLPRVYALGDDPPSPNGFRILPSPRRRVARPPTPR
ncbi:hypothetical protein LRS13_20420 [Svornostia abyssi]|uniref:Uncharacterized protein n=1 Tax=Svornostia abyssi TaxID=2898438 RepID=A0ABY5PEH3_9ACTN|nr:hypothetical protein LRS13_20420 [Parviterribacteraceae bacterium J379]